jgi:archaetidylinositol phosphate synthase
VSDLAQPAPLDARLARRLVRPLRDSWVTPNHLTTLRLALGLAAAGCFAAGALTWAHAGAWLFVLSNFVDHTDGELARLSGKSSRCGHYYDLACDALIHVLLFVGMGYGLRAGILGHWSLPLGALAGASVAGIFWLHLHMEKRLGKTGAGLPAFSAFEIEDVLYLLPLVALFELRLEFVLAAAVGAPAFGIWLLLHYRSLSPRAPTENKHDGAGD